MVIRFMKNNDKLRIIKIMTFLHSKNLSSGIKSLTINKMADLELLPEHRFSPSNVHASRILEPCILPLFSKVNQAVGYKPVKHLYIQRIPLFNCYVYTLIYIT